jgi:signal transduction histidine kinase
MHGHRIWMTAALIASWAVNVSAGVRIDRVVADGRELAVPTLPATRESELSVGSAPVHIPWGTKRVEFHFSGGWGIDAPDATAENAPAMARGMRLRHQLDRVDDGWRDAAAKARLFMQFHDAKGRVLDTAETTLDGESGGWEGRPERSAFHSHRLLATAPPGSARVTAHFLSHGGPEVVGWVGIDDIAFTISPHDGGPTRHQPLPLTVASSPLQPLDTPEGWARRGSRSAIAQLRLRSVPEPHPILVLLDDAPDDYAGWSLVQGLPIAPGDRVQLTWTAAYSLGVGGSTVARYTDLRPGSYTFRIGAFRPGGEPTGRETSLALDIVVPWYRRPETWAAAATLGIGLAVAIGRTVALKRVKRRLQEVERAHALERERTRIARDLHDEVGAALTEIAMQHYWVQKEITGLAAPATLDRVEKARQSAVDLVRSVDAIVWAVNPANDTLDRFVPYLTHSIEQFAEAAGVRLELDVPDRVPPEPIDGGTRHSLFLVVREAVNNAVKHGRPSRLRFHLQVQESGPGSRLSIMIADDGQGCDHSALTAGERSGITNMRRRIDELGGRFSITSSVGEGTRVEIDMPLPAEAGVS